MTRAKGISRVVRLKLAVLKALRMTRLLGRERHRGFRDYVLVEGSSLFDRDWYLRRYPDVAKNCIDPVWHYCVRGWREGRSPSPRFDGRAYLRANRDVREQEINPLVHYVTCGQAEGRACMPLGDGPAQKAPPAPKAVRGDYRPLVSVVVASYNYERFVGETLDSILAQTYDNFEIVVVDDGSKDGSVDLVRGYAARDPRVRLLLHEGGVNRGLPATVQLGVASSRGEYVAFCESDDLWMPNHLEAKVLLLNAHRRAPDIVINDVEPFGDEKRVRAARSAVNERMIALDKDRNDVTPVEFREKNWIATFSCCMVRKRVLEACDYSTPRPANLDWWLWRQVCCGRPIYVVREKLTKWRMHDSFMASESLESVLRQREFIGRMDEILLRNCPEKAQALRPLFERARSCTVVGGVLQYRGAPAACQPRFSVVMPTYNRAFCICDAVDSLLAQTYRNFELVIVDDGSTDNTREVLEKKYGAELSEGRIKYFKVENGGTCRARNIGLGHVSGDWIAYLDSDNTVCPFFLETFCREIVLNPDAKNLYAKLVCVESRRREGRPFDLDALLRANFIDLGVYVHRRELIDELGPFDTNMTRLVDWELIVRQCKRHTPVFIDEIVLLYNDSKGFARITNSVSLKKNMDYFRLKHCNYPVVTTMITCYNHEKFIRRAIESALMQKGEFVHEILVSDDCSTDGTHAVIKELMELYPGCITDISGDANLGISANMRKCFHAAKGQYVAVLEGDDYWTSEWKLNRQVRFLKEHPECSMMFCRIKVLDQATGKFSLLPRQDRPKCLLTGEDFIRDPNQNIIANFSCCMFVTACLRKLPELIYTERFNEIGASFALEQMGPIGFIPDVMTAYRLHPQGVWSAIDRRRKLESAIRTREVALALAAPRYKARMEGIIDGLKKALAKIEE